MPSSDRETLQRIAVEFANLHRDTPACDSVGEIYFLLRSALGDEYVESCIAHVVTPVHVAPVVPT